MAETAAKESKPKRKSAASIARAKAMKQRRTKLDLKNYAPTEKSVSGRVAEFLDHCARNYPRCIITQPEIAQAVFSLGKLPTENSSNIKSVRGAMTRAGKLLMEKYNRTLITERCVGARASADEADKLMESVTREAEKHRRTGAKLTAVVKLVNEAELEKCLEGTNGDPEAKAGLLLARSWFEEYTLKYVASLEKADAQKALLPPVSSK